MAPSLAENLVFLTGKADHVPLAWTAILEQEIKPPLRVDSWNKLITAVACDVVFVFPDCYDDKKPKQAEVRQALPTTTWIAIMDAPDATKMREAFAAGYDEVFDRLAAPALILGPLLRLRESRRRAAEEQRLLEESLAAYQELSALDRVRELLRVLDLQELAPRIVRELASVLGVSEGTLWLPSEDGDSSGVLKPMRTEGARLWGNVDSLALHSLGAAAAIINGNIVQSDWQGRKTVFVPMLENDLLIALVELPRSPDGGALLKRDENRLRMLRDWLKIALQNSLEAEQMRRVLRSRFGDFFAPESFEQHLQKALLQASRYHRPLTLIALDYQGPERSRKKLFQFILELLRDADVFEEPQGGRGKIFLPETGYLGGVQFLRRIQREVGQKFQAGVVKQLAAAITSYPWHASDVKALTAHLNQGLAAAIKARETVMVVQSERVHRLLDLLAKHPHSRPLDDPNLWADLAFHLVQETTLIDPEATRMLLFLGAHAESTKTFAALLEYTARWDRILLAASVADEKEAAPGPMRVIRDPNMTGTYLTLLERPTGAIAAWVRASKNGGAWQGAICQDVHLVRAVFNRFEDQYLLHHKWVP